MSTPHTASMSVPEAGALAETRGPFDVSEYESTSRFREIEKHVSVCVKETREVVATTGPVGDPRSVRDAFLFAAAPDLLASLEELYGELRAEGMHQTGPGLRARAAILKARGR